MHIGLTVFPLPILCSSPVPSLKHHHFVIPFPVPILLPQQVLLPTSPRATCCPRQVCLWIDSVKNSFLLSAFFLPLISAKPDHSQISSENSALLWWLQDKKEMRVSLLLAAFPEVCFLVCPVHPLVLTSFFMAWLLGTDRSLSSIPERPRSPNPWVGFTAVQIPVWAGRSGFKNPFSVIGGVHYVPQWNPALARREPW